MSNFEDNLSKNGEVEIMNDDEKKELKEIVAEISRIADLIRTDVENDMSFPRWKLRLHFAMIKELVWQAEAIVARKKGGKFEDF